MRKLIYIVIGIIALLIAMVITGKKSVHHEIIINAPVEQVWQVLTNTEAYPEWNPTLQLAKGEIKEGENVVYKFTQSPDNAYDVPVTVQQIIPNRLLNQKGGYPFILAYNHKYILESEGTGTKMTIHEDYSGIGVNFWNPKPVEVAYGKLNKALKKRVESLN